MIAHVERAKRDATLHPTICTPSLLVPFCGLVRMVSLRQASITFVVMQSVFGRPIEAQWDLKGSSVNRCVGGAPSAERAQKDADFGARRRVRVGAVRRAMLLAQIERDTILLERFSFCDYSLLLGVRFATATEFEERAQYQTTRLPCGGWLSECGREVYYMAIVDILTAYDLKKKGELALKSVRFEASQISANPPHPYRLVSSFCYIFVFFFKTHFSFS